MCRQVPEAHPGRPGSRVTGSWWKGWAQSFPGTGSSRWTGGPTCWEASRAAEGGSITERHILYAVARNVVRARSGKGQPLASFLRGSLGLHPCAADGDLARRCRRTRRSSTISWGSEELVSCKGLRPARCRPSASRSRDAVRFAEQVGRHPLLRVPRGCDRLARPETRRRRSSRTASWMSSWWSAAVLDSAPSRTCLPAIRSRSSAGCRSCARGTGSWRSAAWTSTAPGSPSTAPS